MSQEDIGTADRSCPDRRRPSGKLPMRTTLLEPGGGGPWCDLRSLEIHEQKAAFTERQHGLLRSSSVPWGGLDGLLRLRHTEKVWTLVTSLVRVGNGQIPGCLVDNSDISTGCNWTLAGSVWTLVIIYDQKTGRYLVIPWTPAMKLIENLIFLLVVCKRKSPNGHRWIT